MSLSDLAGAFITGVLAVAALSLIVKPGGQFAQVVKSFGESFAYTIQVAKA